MAIVKEKGKTSGNKIQDHVSFGNRVECDGASNIVKCYTNGNLVATFSINGDLFMGSGSGAERGIEVVQSTGNSNFGIQLTNNSTGDARIGFSVSGQSYGIGIDNSDSDKLKISTDADDVGSGTIITITAAGKVGIGTTTPTSYLDVPSLSTGTVSKTVSFTADDTFSTAYADATSGAIVATLPATSGIIGRIYRLVKTDSSANSVTVTPNIADTINGLSSVVLSGQYDWVEVQAIAGNQWLQLGTNNVAGATISMDDGSAASPSLFYTLDPNTGLFRQGTDSIGVSTNGVERLRVSTSGMTLAVGLFNIDGSNTTPSYSFTNDSNSGIFSANPDEIGFSTNATTRFRIGTSYLKSELPIASNGGSQSAPAFTTQGDENTGIFSAGADLLGFASGGSEIFRIDSGGILMGNGGNASTPSIRLSGGNGFFLPGTNIVAISTAGTERVTIGATGIVTFTSDVSAAFDVVNTTNSSSITGQTLKWNRGTANVLNNDNFSLQFRSDSNTTASSIPSVIAHYADDVTHATRESSIRLLTHKSGVNYEVAKFNYLGFSITTGSLFIPDGTYAASGLAFSLDTDTGISRPAANTIALNCNGVNQFYIDTTQLSTIVPIHTNLGTAGAPSYSFNGDFDTGVYSAGGDTLNFAAAGASVGYFNPNGLTVQVSGSAATPSIALNDTDTGLYLSSSNRLSITAGGVQRFTIGGPSGTASFYATGAFPFNVYCQSTTGTSVATFASSWNKGPANVLNGDSSTITIFGDSNTTTDGIISKILFTSEDVTHATRSSSISFQPMTSGTNTTVLTLKADQLLAVNGSQSAPAYSFISDTDTGLRRSGVNTMDLTCGGVNSIEVSDTYIYNQLTSSFVDGSAVVPSISFINDPNSGIYSIGADNIGVTAGGVAGIGVTATSVAAYHNLYLFDKLYFDSSVNGVINTPNSLRINIDSDNNGTAEAFAIGNNQTTIDGNNQLFVVAENGQSYFTNGAVGTPSISFLNSQTTGLYRQAADTIGFVSAGTEIARIDAAGLLLSLSGSASVPAIRFVGDENIGIFRFGTDNLSISGGGTESLRIGPSYVHVLATSALGIPSGNASTPGLTFNADLNTGLFSAGADAIGISCGGIIQFYADTTQLSSSVHVRNISGTAGIPSYSFNSDQDTGIYNPSNGSIGFATNGLEYFRITDVGPGSYGVFGSIANSVIRLSDGTAGVPVYSFGNDDDTGIWRPGANTFSVTTAGIERVRIASNGNVGIGTSPGTRFHVLENTEELKWLSDTGNISELVLSSSKASSAGMGISNIIGQGKNSAASVVSYTQLVFGATTDTSTLEDGLYNFYALSGGVTTLHLKIEKSQVKFRDGSVSVPSIAFINDTDTGIYLRQANSIGISCGGVEILDITSSGGLEITSGRLFNSNGTAGQPAYTFSNNQDLGMYRYGANQLGFSTSGNFRMRITDGALDCTPIQVQAKDGTAAAPGYSFGNNTTCGLYNTAGVVSVAITGAESTRFTTQGTAILGGSDTAPSLYFIGDSNTGLYNIAADRLGFTAGGGLRAEFNTTGLAMNVNGSATTPSIYWNGDGNTGFWWQGADTIGVGAGGSASCYFDAGGISIGQNGSAGSPCIRLNDNNTGIFLATTDSIGFSSAGTENLRINGDIVSQNGARFRGADGSASNPGYGFANDTNTGMFLVAADSLGFSTAGTEKMRIDGVGLGIGVAPAYSLDVYSGSSFPTARFARNGGTAGTTGAGYIGFSNVTDGGSSNADLLVRSDYAYFIQTDNAGTVKTAFTASVSGTVFFPNHGTTASASNAYLDSSTGQLQRQTSSIKYKRNVVTLDSLEASEMLHALRVVTYKSKIPTDDQDDVFLGLIAEETDLVSEMLTFYDENNEPNGVQYDRVALLAVAELQKVVPELKQVKQENEDLKNHIQGLEERLLKLETLLYK